MSSAPASCHILWFYIYNSMMVNTVKYLFMYIPFICVSLNNVYSGSWLSLWVDCLLHVFLLHFESFLHDFLWHTKGLPFHLFYNCYELVLYIVWFFVVIFYWCEARRRHQMLELESHKAGCEWASVGAESSPQPYISKSDILKHGTATLLALTKQCFLSIHPIIQQFKAPA